MNRMVEWNWIPSLDIITNLIGVMIFIAVAIALQTQDVSVAIGTPVLRNATQTKSVDFECAGDRVLPIDWHGLWDKAERVARKRFGNSRASWYDWLQYLNTKDIGNEFYQARYKLKEGNQRPLGVYARRNPQAGDSLKDLIQDSAFEKLLKNHDPAEEYIFFWVREDSFPAFRRARAIAREYGFKTGWEPIKAEEDLSFYLDGLGGGTGGTVQN